MLKYFRFPTKTIGSFSITQEEEAVRKINDYAEENNLKITQVSTCDNGLFVLFEKLN